MDPIDIFGDDPIENLSQHMLEGNEVTMPVSTMLHVLSEQIILEGDAKAVLRFEPNALVITIPLVPDPNEK